MADAYIYVRRYPMLRFAGHVDWKRMKLALLNRLSALAAAKGVVLYVFSGYRSDAYSAGHGGFAGDPHTHGIAADIKVGSPGGKAIGLVFSGKVLASFGLRSGNQPDFYHGKPDPEHVDLVGFGYDKSGKVTGSLAKDPYATQTVEQNVPQADTSSTQPQLVGSPPPQTGPAPELTSPAYAMPPGTVSGGQSPIGAAGFWKRVLEQPGVSADTQQYASLFGG